MLKGVDCLGSCIALTPNLRRSVGFASSLGSAQKFEALLAFSLSCFLALISLTHPDSSHLLVCYVD